MINTIKKLADLPNINGFQFLAVKKDGQILLDSVTKDSKGLHRISDYKNTIGWLPIDKYLNQIK